MDRTIDHLPGDDESIVSRVFRQFQDAEASNRTVDLKDLCAERPDLLPQVEKLIEFHRKRGHIEREADLSVSGPEDPLPEQVARYQIVRRLGRGGFGTVYQAFDPVLDRTVALKVLRRDRAGTASEVDAYLREARLVAKLEHAAIVRVYDCGRTDDGLCWIASQFVDGGDLADRLRQGRLAPADATAIIAAIAEALHAAHKAAIIHRDVKPSNILLDKAGQPFLADFGLALREQEFGRGSGYAGTPRYMSPEQARGEGHRVDGRSDVYSLGVVLYELFCGRAPFLTDSISQLLDQIQTREPPPPRLTAEHLPAELERICLKSLAKRAADRYATAADFADDLRQWLRSREPGAPPVTAPRADVGGSSKAARIVPKGLRAFDSSDAAFFLRLLPGPRGRDGLPESVRFWKSRLECLDETAFNVGLLYGPSGCGKSSFLRAGLIPLLGDHVTAVVIDATPEGTETRLLAAVRKAANLAPAPTGTIEQATPVVEIPSSGTIRQDTAGSANRASPKDDAPTRAGALTDTLTELRRQRKGKLVLVIDQFEQWLAANPEPAKSELLAALRQCDGVALQALLLVRDDFWMATTRCFDALEVRLAEGHNSAPVDLFDRDHARKVLAQFGRSFGKLPAKREDLTADQNAFLDRAVAGLADASGRIVCVRLAVLAEMVKNKPWEPATLDALGGLDGIGVAFLDDTFSARTAPPSHRRHEAAARAVLKALLPPPGTDIKRTLAPRSLLLAASGYEQRPAEFDALLAILDGELRLITPAEAQDGPQYQLTHDFLVPSLREWLLRKQKETRRGRAEILLAERASLWSAKPQRRYLPSIPEWLRLRLLTGSQRRTPSERAMLLKADATHIATISATAFILLMLGWAGNYYYQHQRVRSLVQQITTSDAAKLDAVIESLAPHRDKAAPLIDAELTKDHPEDVRDALRLAKAVGDTDALLQFVREREAKPDDPLLPVALKFLIVDGRATTDQILEFINIIPPKQFGRLVQQLLTRSGGMDDLNRAIAAGKSQFEYKFQPGMGPTATRLTVEEYQRKASRLLIASYQLDQPGGVWGPFAENGNLRSLLIRDLALLGSDPSLLVGQYLTETNSHVKRSILLALGGFPLRALPMKAREEFPIKLLADYRTEPDAGLHSAIDWLLRTQWGHADAVTAIDRDLAGKPLVGRKWRVGANCQTFVELSSDKPFQVGAATGETDRKADASQHPRKLRGPFLFGTKEVTVAEVRRLMPEVEQSLVNAKQFTTTSDCPATNLTWFEVADYCNRLSRAEGLPECYDVEKYDERNFSVKLKPNYLSLGGYRLPTETEWEFAARAGSETLRHYGTSDDLLSQYAWYFANSGDKLHPVGMLKPNDYGLFDMLGNANEWTLNFHATDYPAEGKLIVDGEREADQVLSLEQSRSLRGAAFYMQPPDIRSARRFGQPQNQASPSVGFRLARSLPQKD